MQAALLVVFYFITPILINFICYKYSFAKKIGAVLFAYLLGLIVGNVGIFPEASLYLQELISNKDIDISTAYIQDLVNKGVLANSDLAFYSLYSLQDSVIMSLNISLFVGQYLGLGKFSDASVQQYVFPVFSLTCLH